jgi:DNA primase
VATDNNPTGQQAVERIYWQLTARGNDPRRLILPAGLDPADLLHRSGATALQTAIDTSSSLADTLLAARLTPALRKRSTSDIHAALREVGAIIVALPPSRWLAHIDRVTEAFGVPPGTVHQAVLDTETITAAPRGTTTGPPQASRLTPPYENHHRTAHTGQPSQGTRPDLHHSR